MTARTRQAAACLEAAEHDIRSLVTWSEIDRLAHKIGQLSGVTRFDPQPQLITRKVAKVPAALVDCALCGNRPMQCECDPNASWAATYALFRGERNQ